MERNFDRRVEVITPVEDPALVRHLRENILDMYLKDTVNARELCTDGSWKFVRPKGKQRPFDVQAWFNRYYKRNMALGT